MVVTRWKAEGVEAQWLVQRVKEEMKRRQGGGAVGVVAEYRDALWAYEEILKRAE